MKSTRRSVLRAMGRALLTLPWATRASIFAQKILGSAQIGSGCVRTEICLNGRWESSEAEVIAGPPKAGWLPERVPGMPRRSQRFGARRWYRTTLDIPEAWKGETRAFYIRFEKVGHYAAVFCNGNLVGEHYGQYTPFQVYVTGQLKWGQTNEVSVLVSNAAGKFARQDSDIENPFQGNAYRGATINVNDRNWIGIVGDVSLGWHPALGISDVFVTTSVRESSLALDVTVEGIGTSSALQIRSTVFDDGKSVLDLPEETVAADGKVRTKVQWTNPVLWGPEPYGSPKLYTVRVELWKGTTLVDRTFTRFGFREVWIDGRELVLNGKRLWVSGTYFNKLGSNRYLNDRHSQTQLLRIMQQSGLNLLHGHWDTLGQSWLNRCDEMGMLVMSAFFCDGRPDLQSEADPGWENWMAMTCRHWVLSERNHPSIILRRPTDVIPQNLWDTPGKLQQFRKRMAYEVREVDVTRPLVDDSDILGWAQSPLKDMNVPGDYDDGSRMTAALASADKPFLTKEIYPNETFNDFEGLKRFLQEYYGKAYASGGAGIIVQHIPLIDTMDPFEVAWLSESGEGNRDREFERENLPNWCDPTKPIWKASRYSRLFADLYKDCMQRTPWVFAGKRPGEVFVFGLEKEEIVLMVPVAPQFGDAIGIRASTDGAAWLVTVPPGPYHLYCNAGLVNLSVTQQHIPEMPGYAAVQRVNAKALFSDHLTGDLRGL